MLDVSVFTNMRFTAGSLAVTFAFFSLFGFVFVVTQYFQFVRGYSALEAGVRTVPFAVFMASTAPLAAKLAERVGTKPVVTGGMVSMGIGFFIATTNGVDTPYSSSCWRCSSWAVGSDWSQAPATESIMGVAAAGQGRRRVRRQRHRPRARRHPRRGDHRQRVLVGVRSAATDPWPAPRCPTRRSPLAQDSVGAAKEVAAQAGATAGPDAEAFVDNAVNRAFIDGWHAGSWVSVAVVLLGAVLAWRFLPARAAPPPSARTCIQMLRQSATIRCKNGRRWGPVASADVSSTPSASVAETAAALTEHGYLPDEGLATAVYLAMSLRRPLLLEGEAGVGKTEVAKVLAAWTGGELIRLQCYEGIDAAQAVYDWDYGRQLLHLRAAEASGESAGRSTDALEAELYQERFLIKRALLLAIERREGPPPVLLVDEIDRADDEFEAYLLEVLSDWQITIPELGVFRASDPPVVVLTSNRTRDVHDALKRRCLYHWVEHPDFDREVAIVRLRAPEVAEPLARQVAAAVEALRGLALYKPPGVAETIDWATALGRLGATELDERSVEATLGTVLKYREDHERVEQHGFADIVKQAFERGAVRT